MLERVARVCIVEPMHRLVYIDLIKSELWRAATCKWERCLAGFSVCLVFLIPLPPSPPTPLLSCLWESGTCSYIYLSISPPLVVLVLESHALGKFIYLRLRTNIQLRLNTGGQVGQPARPAIATTPITWCENVLDFLESLDKGPGAGSLLNLLL